MSEQGSAAPIQVTVAVEDVSVDRIGGIAARLQEAGLRDPQSQSGIGVITGSVEDPEQIGALEAIDGVAAVEVAREFQLPPPDSPIQ